MNLPIAPISGSVRRRSACSACLRRWSSRPRRADSRPGPPVGLERTLVVSLVITGYRLGDPTVGQAWRWATILSS